MAHYGTLKDFRFESDADEIRGANVYGSDGDKLGDIDDVIFDHSSGEIRYVVVDAGGWLTERKFLVPVDSLQPRGDKDDEFVVNVNRQQVERFPRYDESMFDSEDRDERERRFQEYEGQYRQTWTEAGGVLHREGSTRIITPEEQPASGGGISGSSDYKPDLTPRRIAKSPEPITHVSTNESKGAYEEMRPSLGTESLSTGSTGQQRSGTMGGGSLAGHEHEAHQVRPRKDLDAMGETPRLRQDRAERLGRFESRLRERRGDVVGRCGICGSDSRKVA